MSTTLSALRDAVPVAELSGADVTVDDAVHDSREATAGALFCALPGEHTDGHDHVADAVARGATAVFVERAVDVDVPQLRVPSTRAALGLVASAVHGEPSRAHAVVGITGTNGKTTTAALVEAAVAAAGRGSAVIGTTGARVHGTPVPNERTTPEATDLQRLLRSFVDRGAEVTAMEVSSHGLALHRVDGTRFAVAGFTMLGEDHLDFHGNRGSYLAAKQRLFTSQFTDRAVVVVDDEAGVRVAAETEVPVTTVSTRGDEADLRLTDVALDLDGGRGTVVGRDGSFRVATQLLGHHNLANAVLAVVLAEAVSVPRAAAVAGVAACAGVGGRMERVPSRSDQPTVLVDYAHTPDALRAAVASLRGLLGDGRLAVVVGAGGDRDTTKRGPMGAAVADADLAVLTSDNPRSEDPARIVRAVADGAHAAVAAGAGATVHEEVDRRAAIAHAIAWAGPGDVVLLAGKGHETGQTFADGTVPFDDRVVAAELLSGGVG